MNNVIKAWFLLNMFCLVALLTVVVIKTFIQWIRGCFKKEDVVYFCIGFFIFVIAIAAIFVTAISGY